MSPRDTILLCKSDFITWLSELMSSLAQLSLRSNQAVFASFMLHGPHGQLGMAGWDGGSTLWLLGKMLAQLMPP